MIDWQLFALFYTFSFQSQSISISCFFCLACWKRHERNQEKKKIIRNPFNCSLNRYIKLQQLMKHSSGHPSITLFIMRKIKFRAKKMKKFELNLVKQGVEFPLYYKKRTKGNIGSVVCVQCSVCLVVDQIFNMHQ